MPHSMTPVRREEVLLTSVRVRDEARFQNVAPKVEGVPDDEVIRFDSHQLPDNVNSCIVDVIASRNDQGVLACRPLRESKRSRGDVHLPIPNQEVAVRSEATKALVLVDVVMVSIQEIAVTDNEIDDWIRLLVDLGRIPTEDVEDRPSIVVPARNPAVAVVTCLTSGPRQTLDLVPLGVVDKREVGIAVPATLVVVESCIVQATPDPVLEVELLVLTTDSVDEHTIRYGL